MLRSGLPRTSTLVLSLLKIHGLSDHGLLRSLLMLCISVWSESVALFL